MSAATGRRQNAPPPSFGNAWRPTISHSSTAGRASRPAFRRRSARTSPSGWHSRQSTPSPSSTTSGPFGKTPSPCSEPGQGRRIGVGNSKALWIDFDLENRTVRIERQFREGRLIDRTKKNKVRLVDLSREVVREFRAHRNWMEQDAAARGLSLSPFVFTTTTGGPIRAKSSFTRRVLRPLVALAGLQRRVTFQNFRQTFCTDLVPTAGERGLLYASEQAGHSSISITADYYGRGASKDKSLVDSLDERVRRAGRRSGSTPRPHQGEPAPAERRVTRQFRGEPSGIRTLDPLIKSQVLYQLS